MRLNSLHLYLRSVFQTYVWNTLLKYRWNEFDLIDSSCLNKDQESRLIGKVSRDLNLVHGTAVWVPEEDMASGIQFYIAIHGCPRHIRESVQLSQFFNFLLTSHSLNTVVAATLHNIQPRAGDNIKDFTAINMWYERLDKRYNFSLGPNILPLMTTENLTTLESLEPPYLEDSKTVWVEYHNDNMSSLFGKISKYSSPDANLE